MSSTRTSSFRHALDHFEPQDDSDPQQQKRLRGQLEHIDYTAFAANKEAAAHRLAQVDAEAFQRLAVAAAQARAHWIAEAVAMTQRASLPTAEQGAQLAGLRNAYEELADVYEGLRRMVERGYLNLDPR